MTAPLSPGTVVAGRYQLERLLGEGGMGSVWAGFHVITKKRVALKFLKAATASEQVVHRFLREARAVSAVNHPNVIGVHDVLQMEDGSPVMVMDFLAGEDLAERLAREHKLPLGDVARLLVPVVSAVATAHAAGIVHRDLKPDNIMLHLRPDGEVEPKVLDFGIAKLSPQEGTNAAATAALTQTGAMLGTPYYMAPEQIFGEKDVDHRADVWAMGVILYECLGGKRPFEGQNFGQLFKCITMGILVPLEQVAPELPRDVTNLVSRMLTVDRNLRPRDLREAYEILRRYTSVQAISFDSPRTVPLSESSTDTRANSVDAFSQTEGPDRTGSPRSLRTPLAAAATGIVIVGLGALWLRPAPPVEQRPSRSAAGSVAPPPSALPLATASPQALPDAAPEETAKPAPSAAAQKGSRMNSVSPPPHHGGVHVDLPPKAPPTVTPVERLPPPPPASTKLPGHVVEEAPF